ncbi:MAG: DNA gyrase inhibitor YacG [Pseudomonadota bacterium]
MSARKSAKTPAKQSAKGAPCPTCQEPSCAEYAPFCSKRCADVDLHRWLSGGYAIPAEEDDAYGVDANAQDDHDDRRTH